MDGAVAVSLVGLDGIAVESIGEGDVPLDTLSAEYGSFIKSIQLSNTELRTGAVQQLALVTDRYITFMSSVTGDYFILLVMGADGNYGRARFELMKARHALRAELS
ncbi:MAG: hypothetical protein ABI718_05825 [Acidobacteriota bacterium]